MIQMAFFNRETLDLIGGRHIIEKNNQA